MDLLILFEEAETLTIKPSSNHSSPEISAERARGIARSPAGATTLFLSPDPFAVCALCGDLQYSEADTQC